MEKEKEKVSRRKFLKNVAAGAVVATAGGVVGAAITGYAIPAKVGPPGAAGPAGATGPAGPAGKEGPPGPAPEVVVYPESQGYLVFDPVLCTGCLYCEQVCSAVKNGGKAQPSLSRIQVKRDPFEGMIHNFEPKPCYQCMNPKCIPACPVKGAMYVDAKTGARVVDETKCIGCKLCIDACGKYYDPPRIVFDPEKKKAIKCDLCGGDPKCVKWCSNGALKYITLSELREAGSIQQNFLEPYTKDFGPDFVASEGYKVTFEKAYPYKQK